MIAALSCSQSFKGVQEIYPTNTVILTSEGVMLEHAGLAMFLTPKSETYCNDFFFDETFLAGIIFFKQMETKDHDFFQFLSVYAKKIYVTGKS